MKIHWDYVCDEYMATNLGKVVTVYKFSELFSITWKRSMTAQNIMAGFRSTGIYPFNRHAIVLPGENRLKKFGTPTAVLAKKKGIAYMPFFFPAHIHDNSQHDSEVFTSDELQHFEHRFEEGYDLGDDERYNQ